jgi:RNA polymerase sigma-70 factor (ECF subfamily)
VKRKAFDDFYRHSKDRCYRALLASVGDVAETDDLLAEAYARAWHRWSDVTKHPAPEAWVVRVALNLHKDNWRSRRLSGRLRPSGPVAAPELDLDVDLLQALRNLPERQREVVVFRILLDHTNDQVAATMGIAPATVSVHLHRALSALRLTVHSPVEGNLVHDTVEELTP